jgi:dihydrofolate reductase
VADGIENALKQAREVAQGRPVAIGSADVAQQFLRAGLLDEIQLNLVPILLGRGVALFENHADRHVPLECVEVIPSDGVTHLRYRVLGRRDRPRRAR